MVEPKRVGRYPDPVSLFIVYEKRVARVNGEIEKVGTISGIRAGAGKRVARHFMKRCAGEVGEEV